MLYVSEEDLNNATEMLLICARKATDVNGLRIYWSPKPEQVRRMLLGTLVALAPNPDDAVVPEGVHFIQRVGGGDPPDLHVFPKVKKDDETRKQVAHEVHKRFFEEGTELHAQLTDFIIRNK